MENELIAHLVSSRYGSLTRFVRENNSQANFCTSSDPNNILI